MIVSQNIIKLLDKYNINIISCQQQIDTTHYQGRYMMNAYFNLSELEHQTTISRSAYGKEERRKRVGWVGGRIHYGYMKEDKTDKDSLPIINDYEAKIIRYIYDVYHNHKYSCTKVAKVLNNQEIKPAGKGKCWYQKTIIIILDNKDKYEGSLMNGNENSIYWPKILDKVYPIRRMGTKRK